MAAARQPPDLFVRPVGDERGSLGIAAEEFLTNVGAVFRLEILVFAVNAFFHQLRQLAGRIAREEFVPLVAPDDLDDVPTSAAEVAFEFLNDFSVAAHRAVEALQIAVNDEDQIVEPFASGERDRAKAFRLVHLAVAAEHPYVAIKNKRNNNI